MPGRGPGSISRVRTVGVEEEFFLVDPQTRRLRAAAAAVVAAAADAKPELQCTQVEFGTPPAAALDDVRAHLVRMRRDLAQAARSAGCAIAATGAAPGNQPGTITASDRYQAMAEVYGPVARGQQVCGCHVHVAVEFRELAVAVSDHVRPWLAVLLAVSANSPFWAGADTGYASWRSQVWSRWPTAGPPGYFGSLAAYEQTAVGLVATGAARDRAMLYFDVRPSDRYPTVEFRVADVCLTVDDTVLVAALTRGLVETAVTATLRDQPAPDLRPELVRGAHWRAARYGLTADLFDLCRCRRRPAEQVLRSLLSHVCDALEGSGDFAEVSEQVDRVLRVGTGADRQRRAYQRHGSLDDAVDAVLAATVP